MAFGPGLLGTLGKCHLFPVPLTVVAMDTTSSALSRILWLLATYQDVQDKLRFEIREAQRKPTLQTFYMMT